MGTKLVLPIGIIAWYPGYYLESFEVPLEISNIFTFCPLRARPWYSTYCCSFVIASSNTVDDVIFPHGYSHLFPFFPQKWTVGRVSIPLWSLPDSLNAPLCTGIYTSIHCIYKTLRIHSCRCGVANWRGKRKKTGQAPHILSFFRVWHKKNRVLWLVILILFIYGL